MLPPLLRTTLDHFAANEELDSWYHWQNSLLETTLIISFKHRVHANEAERSSLEWNADTMNMTSNADEAAELAGTGHNLQRDENSVLWGNPNMSVTLGTELTDSNQDATKVAEYDGSEFTEFDGSEFTEFEHDATHYATPFNFQSEVELDQTSLLCAT